MVATGLFLLLDPLQDGPIPPLAPIGLVATTVSDILLGYLILAFPWGTLRSNVDRVFLAVSGVALVSANLVAFAAYDPRAFGRDYDNPYLLIRDPGIASAAVMLSRLTSIVVLLGFLAHLRRPLGTRLRPGAADVLHRSSSPRPFSMIAIMVSAILSAFPVPDELSLVAGVTQALARAFIPIGFLVGLMRTRMARSAVADLVVELGETPAPARLRDALANALGDPASGGRLLVPAVEGVRRRADGTPIELPDRRAPGGRSRSSSATASRSRRSSTTRCCSTIRASSPRWRARCGWRSRTNGSRPRSKPSWARSASRGRASSPPATPSESASSATSTTVPSNGWSR